MRVLPQTYRQCRIQQAHCCDDEEQTATMLNNEDVEIFLNTTCEADYQELMNNYSSPFQPLYGAKEYFQDGNIRGIAFLSENETVNDFKNLSRLLTMGLKLCALLKQSGIGYQEIEYHDIEKQGIEVEEDIAFGDYYSLGIELEPEPETIKFLKKGLDNAWLRFPRCGLNECPDNGGASSSIVLHISTGLIKSTSGRFRKACISLLDALSTIMLHDLSVGVENGAAYQICESTASSLWYTLLESFKEGRADFCKVCDKPFISLDERKNKRLFCSGKCNKMHQRLEKFRRFVSEGLHEEEAAKKAGVAVSRAKAFYGCKPNITDTSPQ